MTKVIQYQSGMANAFFVVDESVIAVDAGAITNEEDFIQSCASCGINPKDIRLIVITHGHCDHFLNLTAMQKVTGAPAICHKNAEKALLDGSWPNKIGRTWIGKDIMRIEAVEGTPITTVPQVKPDMTFEGEFNLQPYGVHGKIISVYGHSEGDACVILDDGQAIVGDLFAEAPGYGKPGPAFFMMPENNFMDAIDSIEGLLEIIPHIQTFYSGHGGPFTRKTVAETTAEEKTKKNQGED